MSTKGKLKTIIRTIVREEVNMAIQEVITELKKPTQSQPQKKIVEKKQFTKNSILNDVLNETVLDEDWKQMGGGTYDSSRMNEVLGSAYGKSQNPDQVVASMGKDPNQVDDATKKAITRDYSDLMKAINDRKKGSPLKGRR